MLRTCPGFHRDSHECDESDFYADAKRRGGGLSRLCKECHKAKNREYFKSKYYPKHAEELKDAVKNRRAAAKESAPA